MYISISSHFNNSIEVDYREDTDVFLFKFGVMGNMAMSVKDLEHLYNEIGSALMHRHYSQSTEVKSEWEN
jgi:hypothetical protein